MNAGAPSTPELVANEGLNKWLVALETKVKLDSTADALFCSRYQRMAGLPPELTVWMFQIRLRDWMLAFWNRPSRLSSFCPLG